MLKKKLGIEAIERGPEDNDDLKSYFKIPTTLIIPEDCERIGNAAFYECRNLREVVIPGSVKSIGECAFADCLELERVIVPKSVERIEYGAFWKCINAEITVRKLKSEFKFIALTAFGGCENVKEEIRD